MRFLKNKIARASSLNPPTLPQETPTQKSAQVIQFPPKETSLQKKPQSLRPKQDFPSHSPWMLKKHISGDNIIKNYGRAMTNFALSGIAQPYLQTIMSELNISLESFSNFITKRKKSANCIKKLRAMLPMGTDEDEEDLEVKVAFQKICIVFLKFFVANWLYSSKIAEKVVHLQYRFKILRRVRNPQYFTYLKDFSHAPFSN